MHEYQDGYNRGYDAGVQDTEQRISELKAEKAELVALLREARIGVANGVFERFAKIGRNIISSTNTERRIDFCKRIDAALKKCKERS